MSAITRGGSRIPRRRGHQPRGGGAPTYDFAKFCEKLHDIEKILGRWGGGGLGAGGAPLNPPLNIITSVTFRIAMRGELLLWADYNVFRIALHEAFDIYPDLITIQDTSYSKCNLYLNYRCWPKNNWNIVTQAFYKSTKNVFKQAFC